MDFKTNARYFRDFNWKAPAVLMVLGAVLIAASPAGGIVLLFAGGGWLVYQVQSRVEDHVLDNALQSQLTNVRGKALNKLNLDESQVTEVEPVVITGYNYTGFNKAKKGKDGRWRTSDGKAVVIFFDDHQLYAYSWAFSLTDPNKHPSESTDEYFYRDVVSMSTATDTWRPPVGGSENFEIFKLTTSGGTSVTCPLWGQGSDKSIQGARTKIAEKKRELK